MSNTLKVNKKDFELNPTFEKMAVMKWGHCGVLDFLTKRRCLQFIGLDKNTENYNSRDQ